MVASDLPSDSSAAASLPELEALGCSLRQAREAQGLSLEALAARLNMGCEQLAALENGNREGLREAVFVIAQARRIAGSLGVSVDSQIEALRRNPAFDQAPPKSKPQAPSRPPSPTATRHQPASAGAVRSPQSAPPRRFPLPVLALGLVAAAGGGAVLVAQQRGTLPLGRPASAPPPEGRPAPAAGSPAADSLVLEAQGRSWLEVTTPEGKTLFRGTLEGSKRFPLGQGLRVLAGRPDLVRAQVGAGPAQVLGPIDQVQWRRFAPGVTAPAP